MRILSSGLWHRNEWSLPWEVAMFALNTALHADPHEMLRMFFSLKSYMRLHKEPYDPIYFAAIILDVSSDAEPQHRTSSGI